MKDRINVAELLKDCPEGMELDCTMYDDVFFYEITDDPVFPIRIKRIDGPLFTLTKYGEYANCPSAKCVIFPEGKTTWEGFVPPHEFKDGDIAISDKGDIHLLRTKDSSYCAYRKRWKGLPEFDETITASVKVDRLATEEEKAELFQAIKDNGYKWNEVTKTLEELSMFEDGDILSYTTTNTTVFIYRNKYNEPNHTTSFYVGYTIGKEDHNFHVYNKSLLIALNEDCEVRFATEEEKQKLFDAIKANGYKWNTETKTLKKLPKFEDGDIVANDSVGGAQVFIFKEYIDSEKNYVHCYMMLDNDGAVDFEPGFCYVERFATEEEKQKLFKVIKANGYKWNAETKTLEKLIKPWFKVWDKIRLKNDKTRIETINYIYPDSYGLCSNHLLFFKEQDEYELVPNKFDITTLKPFESKVLVWDDALRKWIPAFWGSKCDGGGYITTYGWCKYCIPFDGNEYLTGTSKDCDKFYKTWK